MLIGRLNGLIGEICVVICRGGFRSSSSTPLPIEITVLLLPKCLIGSRNPPDAVNSVRLSRSRPKSGIQQNPGSPISIGISIRNVTRIFPQPPSVGFDQNLIYLPEELLKLTPRGGKLFQRLHSHDAAESLIHIGINLSLRQRFLEDQNFVNDS